GCETNCFGLILNWGFVRGLWLEELVLDVEIGTVKFGARLFESGKLLFADSFEGLLLPCAQLELDAQVLRNRGTGGGLFEFGFVELIFERVEGCETNCFGLVLNWGFVRGLRLKELVLDVEIGTVKFGARLFESGKLLFADSFEGLLLPCAQLEWDAQVLRNRGTGGGLFEFGFVELIFERVGLLCIIPTHR
ncbi:hypothetical protein Droror1_Dr00009015, partial [Drosera rotundifolia]